LFAFDTKKLEFKLAKSAYPRGSAKSTVGAVYEYKIFTVFPVPVLYLERINFTTNPYFLRDDQKFLKTSKRPLFEA
jgi:hypothetical protein